LNDIRVLATLLILVILGVGLLVAKVIGLPFIWVFGTVGFLAVVVSILVLVLSGWSP
jgi:hypothetical protein